MKVSEIKQAINDNKKVYWKNGLYEVIKDKLGQYLIYCKTTDYCIRLTHQDNKALNGEESDFYIKR